MSFALIQKVNNEQKKAQVVDVRSGDTVRVHQKIKEGNKERIQIFEGVVIRTDNKSQHTSRITVRKIASGVGVEKSFLLHSPLVEKIEITRRAKVRRNFLSYLRARSGKSARLSAVQFDREAVNSVVDKHAEEEAARLKEEAKKEAEAKQAEQAKRDAQRADNCNRAKQAKVTLTSGRMLSSVNANGERGFMDEATRDAEVKRADAVIASECGPAPEAE